MPTPKVNKQKLIYYSPSEWETICNRASRLSLKTGTYIRQISVLGEIKIYNLVDVIDLTTAINRIGNNINQVARMANESRSVNGTDIEMLKNYLEEIKVEINEYVKPLEYNLLE